MNEQFLRFHQITPMNYKKLQLYIQQDPHFEQFTKMSAKQLSMYLRCSPEKAAAYQQQFSSYCPKQIVQFYKEQHIHVICYGDEQYPQALYDIYDPPLVLYVKGKVDALQRAAVAIIGSRKATDYSRYAIGQLMPYCKEANVVIVSGLAKGADTLAHEAAIAHQCDTVAVLGHGFQYMYPKAHTQLANYLAQHHTLVTEYPYHYGPQKWYFPMRNRIISGLSDAVVVTEAERKSGTMSTVDYALAHGKDIFAVPGNIFSPLSEGPNALIAEGATALTLEEMPRFLQHFQ
ncbi:MAG: DNA-processing protein DprA [Caryophanon sp.]|nr:DNA-processing protein DprA [Caryophanon sp.]